MPIFQIIKAANNGKTDADLLSGAGFTVYLKSSLTKKADGSYDFDSAKPVVSGEKGATEIFTDEKGYACSIPLPFGSYIVRETTTPHNYKPVDDFEVNITEHHPNEPQIWRVLLDEEFKAKLKIVKKDDETKKSVLIAGTEFKVYDLDNKKYVEQVTTYPVTTTHKSYFTDSQGYLIMPKNLKIGHYRIEEVNAPEGYTINKNYVEIAVDANTAYQMDSESGDAIITVDYENHPVKGKLTIYKKGEMLTGFKKDFVYEERYLKGAEFNVYAAENIYTPDYQKDENGNRQLIYAKDALVTTVTTGEDGKAVAENLPLGSYYVVEYHDDGEGFTIHTEKDDIWNRMSTQELERLDVKLGQEVLYYHYHNKTVNADTLDKLREIREEIMEEESSYFTAISNRVWTDYDKKEKELSGEVEVSEEKESLEEINGISEPIPATNFRITDDELGQGTAKEKFRANIMAIQLLKKCEDENRNATPEEQEILSRYVGWGGLADAFDETKAAWETEYLELKTVLTPEEYAAARASTLNAHYTQPIVIDSMYQVLENLGFTKGNILEPSMGVGNFFGMLPENLNQSKLYGVELDSISGRIAKLLYPDANIQIKGFEKTDYPNDFFDVTIGNVPFGAYKVNDRQYDRFNFMIHDYFLAKTIDQLRPGGVAALITTKGTMDKASPEVRKYLAERADLLGAIRLPNTAFKANAGTEVSADILFFQKRDSMTNLRKRNDRNPGGTDEKLCGRYGRHRSCRNI